MATTILALNRRWKRWYMAQSHLVLAIYPATTTAQAFAASFFGDGRHRAYRGTAVAGATRDTRTHTLTTIRRHALPGCLQRRQPTLPCHILTALAAFWPSTPPGRIGGATA